MEKSYKFKEGWYKRDGNKNGYVWTALMNDYAIANNSMSKQDQIMKLFRKIGNCLHERTRLPRRIFLLGPI